MRKPKVGHPGANLKGWLHKAKKSLALKAAKPAKIAAVARKMSTTKFGKVKL